MPSEIEIQRIKRRAEQLCHWRNENVSAELGKACFDIQAQQFVFYKTAFAVDSIHCQRDIEVAKLHYEPTGKQWHLFIRSNDNDINRDVEWQAHITHPMHVDALSLLSVIERDQDEYIWG
ncbi:DUF3024 domain-containing protein [Vibrio algicola]|uniref:DUF3024 domain-containing protein n=1 Tax=Vibrio algicola TaxID=2662262 RepID=A0A5Q0TI34_9VIBR|nr:DUF3024 domain-containing protein [Vibrio algicola]